MNLTELLQSIALILGSSIFGIILVAIIVAIDKESYIVLGSMIGLFLWIMIFSMIGAVSLEQQFNLAIAMGRTRKEFLICRYLVQVINTVIGLSAIALLNLIEAELDKLLYKGIRCEFHGIGMILKDFRFLAVVVILVPALYFFMGMLLAKFQKKALWAIWVLWMLGSTLLPRIITALSKEQHGRFAGVISILRRIIDFVKSLGTIGQLAAIVLVSLLLFVITKTVLEKHAVTQI